uniref:DUF5753 domain-containing protein n=1 Tax=Heterorhabditis bacteriophora TaxID=37862 RepID=A0A1I7WSR2_HETBA
MRKAALYILVDRVGYVRDRTSLDDIMRLLAMAADDPDPAIRIYIPTILSTTPPFTTYNRFEIYVVIVYRKFQVLIFLW